MEMPGIKKKVYIYLASGGIGDSILLIPTIIHYLNDPLGSIVAIVSFPFFLFALFRVYDKDILRTIRYPIFIMNFFVISTRTMDIII